MHVLKSKSENQTLKIAADFARTLQGGEVVLLSGDLGAGKSVFTRGVARALGVTSRMTSPTFVLFKVYDTHHDKVKFLVHVDAYRVENDDLMQAGLADYMGRPDTVVMIEWGEKLKKLLSETKLRCKIVHICHKSNAIREINLK
jgi:tRNA threonylcarbamoyladenosine biosynthesis protein TsaE